jgi:predicted DNA-binding transcriptional regulator AlpA
MFKILQINSYTLTINQGTSMNNKLLTTEQAASYICMSKAFLEKDRWAGARIPFIKVGSRAVRYRLSDLDTFLDSQVRQSTSDTGTLS